VKSSYGKEEAEEKYYCPSESATNGFYFANQVTTLKALRVIYEVGHEYITVSSSPSSIASLLIQFEMISLVTIE